MPKTQILVLTLAAILLSSSAASSADYYSAKGTFHVTLTGGFFLNPNVTIVFHKHSGEDVPFVGCTCRSKRGMETDLPYHKTSESLVQWTIDKSKCHEFTVATWQEEGANGQLRYEWDRINWTPAKE